MNLFEIDKAITECVDLETGEIIDFDRLEELQIERESKIENVALWIKNLAADAEALKEQKEVFAEREKAVKSKIEGLKQYLTNALDGEKFTTSKVAVSFRKSQSVEVEDVNLLPEEYTTVKTTVTPDKNGIKDALKSNYALNGCSLVTKQNIQIK